MNDKPEIFSIYYIIFHDVINEEDMDALEWITTNPWNKLLRDTR